MSLTLQIILCIVLADFLTGVFHWLEDCYGVPSWPLIGDSVIEANIFHHENPGVFGSMSSVFSRNYQQLLMFLPLFAGAWFLGFASWQLLLVGVIASFGNEVHAWSHRGGNRVATFLQDAGLALTPAQHAKHHKPPFDRYYCTVTNFTNAILERIEFWRGLEWTIAKCGIPPKRMSAERRHV